MHELPLGPLEQRVLTVLWQKPDQTVSDILHTLNEQPLSKILAYTTILTITRRLQEKGVIVSSKRGRSFVFRAKTNQHDFIKSLVHRTVASFNQHFGEQALAAFIEEAATLSKTDRHTVLQSLKKSTSSPKLATKKHASKQ